ncbi:MAG: hypothetical protein M1836_000024 [Candelina mexicana]|nr:MAG: hypothetical protein M1836_000024 [Candelina mexicana]
MGQHAFQYVLRTCLIQLLLHCLTVDSVDTDLTVRSETLPAAIVVPPSQSWEGNDGQWSTFTFRVGNPPQNVNLLPSTASWQTWVVLPLGCPARYAVSNCTSSRGGIFDNSSSTTWVDKGIYKLILEAVEFNPSLNTSANFGFDTLGIGPRSSEGLSVDHQIFGAFATDIYYLGIFGLNPKPTNYSGFDNPIPSFLTNLKEKGSLPSISFGYTAGASYRPGKVAGSLTLGGYDASRFTPNNLQFTFGPDISRDLLVSIRSITTSNPTGRILMRTPILSFIDSTLPYMYLPLLACQEFEKAFGLIWNEKSQLYLVNDTIHDNLVSLNPTITLELANALTGGQTINITFPYASFDKEVGYPLVRNTTRYFPLMRALNDSQYVLGRTFLQEAYLTVDWERKNFTVSQAVFPDSSTKQHIITIPPLGISSNSTNSTNPSAPTSSKHNGLTKGAIPGIVIGILVVMLVLAVLAFTLTKRRKRRASAAAAAALAAEKARLEDDKFSDPGLRHGPKHELAHEQTQGLNEMSGEAPVADLPIKLRLPGEMEASTPVTELGAKNTFQGQNPATELEGNKKRLVELPAGEVATEMPGTPAQSRFAKAKRLLPGKSQKGTPKLEIKLVP